MITVLKNNKAKLYLKSFDGVTGEIKFTKSINEAKRYQTDWFATTEQKYLMFHFPESKEILKEMIPAHSQTYDE